MQPPPNHPRKIAINSFSKQSKPIFGVCVANLQSNEFERGSMEGSGGHSLAPTGCSKQNAPEQPSPGHDAHRAQSNARVEREGETRAEETLPPHIPAVRIWGPVPKDQAVGVGALAAVSSVVIAPQQSHARLFNSLAALVPDEVLPRASDTAQTLRERLQSSAFLHPIQTKAKGHGRGGRYVKLNWTLRQAQRNDVSTAASRAMGNTDGARAH